MPKRLTDLDVFEVSLVPRGANRKKFLVLKEEVNGMDLEELYEIVTKTEAEGEEALEELTKAGLSEKAINAVKGALRLLNAYKDELPKDILKTLAGLAGYGYPEPQEKAQESKEERPDIKKDDGTLNLEAIPEEVRPAIEALWKEHEEAIRKAQELEAVLKEERDRQLTKEFVAKASAFANLPIKPEELGPVLKRVSESSQEDYQLIEQVLKAADEALGQSRLFAELGSEIPGSEPLGKVEAMAKELVAKSGITYEQAVDRVLVENPELYTEYLRAKK